MVEKKINCEGCEGDGLYHIAQGFFEPCEDCDVAPVGSWVDKCLNENCHYVALHGPGVNGMCQQDEHSFDICINCIKRNTKDEQ